MSKKKRTLTKWTFDFKGAHLAYTDASVGGAASGYNSPILLKSNALKATPEILEIIKDLEEELTPLDKTLGVSNADNGNQNTPSTSASAEAVMAGDDKKDLEGKEKVMSEQDSLVKSLQEQVAKMAFENAVEKSKNVLSKYSLSVDLVEPLAKALASLSDESKDAFVKALDELSSAISAKADEVAELTKAQAESTNSAQEAIVKAAQAATSQEQGHSQEATLPVEKSAAELRAEKIAEAYEKQKQLIQKGAK